MRGLVEEAGLADHIEVDSAGTSSYHVGEPADPRARRAAKDRGVELGSRARQFVPTDWDRFDYVLACDTANHDDLESIASKAEHRSKLYLLRSFDPGSPAGASVPDPYYGGAEGFQIVLDVCEAACRHLLAKIRAEHRLG